MVIFHYHVGFSYLKQVIFQPVMLVFRGISVDFQGRPHDVNKKTLTGHTGSSDGRSVRWECTCTSAMGMGWQGGRRRGNFQFHGNLRIPLQGTNISHLGKRNIIFKMPFLGDMLVLWRVRPDYFRMRVAIFPDESFHC